MEASLALGSYFGRPFLKASRCRLVERAAQPTAAGIATRRRACALRITPRFACWKACSNTSAPRRRAPTRFSQTVSQGRGEVRSHRSGPSPRREYLLARGLFRRLSTGEVANPEFLKFAYPPRYHYDILRALDYFKTAAAQAAARRDVQADVQSDNTRDLNKTSSPIRALMCVSAKPCKSSKAAANPTVAGS